MKSKKRIDDLLVEYNLVKTIKEATALLMAQKVTVNQQIVTTPGTLVEVNAELAIKPKSPYVSRGGYKLAAAFDVFSVDVAGVICADVGASTGGFTDVLLQNGANKVYSLDVGYGHLAWKLRQDPRVVIMERTNARTVETLPEKVSLVVVDVSFISVKKILPAALKWVEPHADFIVLVKPQFEAKKEWVQKGGIIKDKTIHRDILIDITAWCQENSLFVVDLIASPITGPAGNKEFLLHLTTYQTETINILTLIEICLQKLTY